MWRLLLALVIGAALLVPVGASAAEVRTDDGPSLPAGETVAEDLYLIQEEVRLEGTATRDVIAVAGELWLTGTVEGNLNVAAGTVHLDGTVGRSVRVAGGEAFLSGTIGGDLFIASGTLRMEPGARIDGDLYLLGGEADVLGRVSGTVHESTGSLTTPPTPTPTPSPVVTVPVAVATPTAATPPAATSPSAGRSPAATAAGASVTLRPVLTPEASPTATAREIGLQRSRAEWGAGAVTGQPVAALIDLGIPLDGVRLLLGGDWAVIRVLGALLSAVMVALLIPGAAGRWADGIRRAPLRTVVTGLPLTVLLPVLALLLMVTVIGAPFGAVLLGAYVAVVYLGQVFVGLAIGRTILAWGRHGNDRGLNIVAALLGVGILQGLRLMPVDHLDSGVQALTTVLAFGGIAAGSHLLNRRMVIAEAALAAGSAPARRA